VSSETNAICLRAVLRPCIQMTSHNLRGDGASLLAFTGVLCSVLFVRAYSVYCFVALAHLTSHCSPVLSSTTDREKCLTYHQCCLVSPCTRLSRCCCTNAAHSTSQVQLHWRDQGFGLRHERPRCRTRAVQCLERDKRTVAVHVAARGGTDSDPTREPPEQRRLSRPHTLWRIVSRVRQSPAQILAVSIQIVYFQTRTHADTECISCQNTVDTIPLCAAS
jgi:hypothetical protein